MRAVAPSTRNPTPYTLEGLKRKLAHEQMMEEAEAREALLKAEIDETTTKFNRLMAAGAAPKPGGEPLHPKPRILNPTPGNRNPEPGNPGGNPRGRVGCRVGC